jgi:tripartite-type tricarboxylate transporter receptor subunit TctC
VLGQKLHASLGQPVVIDNRGGAGGTLGTAAAAKSAPDGYTLLLVPTSHVINPSIYAKLPFDTEKDFAPITMVASAAILMAVHPRVPADTVRGFVEAAKASPRALANYGSAGTGTVFHLTGELFKQLTGLQLQHVPYRGGAPTVTALLAGEIPLAFETMLALQPHVRAGTLRALAVTSPRRSAIMPEIPTTAEAGFPSLVADKFVCPIRARRHAGAHSDAAARRHGRGARVAGGPRPAARAGRRGGRQQRGRAGRLCCGRDPEMGRAGTPSRRKAAMTGGDET